eukprot:6084547-Pleurochrysis_carterae.AAC.1
MNVLHDACVAHGEAFVSGSNGGWSLTSSRAFLRAAAFSSCCRLLSRLCCPLHYGLGLRTDLHLLVPVRHKLDKARDDHCPAWRFPSAENKLLPCPAVIELVHGLPPLLLGAQIERQADGRKVLRDLAASVSCNQSATRFEDTSSEED